MDAINLNLSTHRPVLTAEILSGRPEIAANLNELRYLVFQGMQGDPGQSAYALAVSLGFEGTERDWIESLQGADGKNYGLVVDASEDYVLELKSVEADSAQAAAVREEVGYAVVDLSDLPLNRGRIEAASGRFINSSSYRYVLLAPQSDWKRMLIYQPFHARANQETSYQATMLAFLTSGTLTAGESAPFCGGNPGVVTLSPYESACLDIPDDCAFVYILIKNNGAGSSTNRDVTPTVWALTEDGELNAIGGLLPDTGLPAYYNSYLADRAAAILKIQNSLSAHHDAFLFITDYHHNSNAGRSLDMIRMISRTTGITKLFFAGDSGGGDPTNLNNALLRLRKSAEVWDDLQRQADEFYGALGNHEWISMSYINRSAVFGSYLNRFKQRCMAMDAYGDYTVNNPVDEMLYIFLQQTSTCHLEYDQLKWLGSQLELLPSGYHVLVVMHHGYIPNEATSGEYGTAISGASYGSETGSHLWAKRVNQILHAYETGGSIEVDGTAYDFAGGTVIGVFCGHYHHGTLFSKDDPYNDEQIMVFRGGTDTLSAATVAYEGSGMPWYTDQDGNRVVRAAGTTNEQCFYAVQIDLDAKKLYITAIGGDHDYPAVPFGGGT